MGEESIPSHTQSHALHRAALGQQGTEGTFSEPASCSTHVKRRSEFSLSRMVGGFFLFVLFCFYRVSLSGTHSVDQAGLKLRDSPASTCQELG